MINGFVKIATAVPHIRLGDCKWNAAEIIRLVRTAEKHGAKLMVFPELCVTGSTLEELFAQRVILEGAENALAQIISETADCDLLFAVGVPVATDMQIFNCAAVICRGRLLALEAKRSAPIYSEHYEARRFTAADDSLNKSICYAGFEVPLSSRTVFRCDSLPDLAASFVLGEDMWSASPESDAVARAGANVILNLSSSNELVGKAKMRETAVSALSARLYAACAYCSAGEGESTTDAVCSGHNIIAQCGKVLAQSRWNSDCILYADIDVERLNAERRRVSTFTSCTAGCNAQSFTLSVAPTAFEHAIDAMPFVPSDEAELEQVSVEALAIQTAGLKSRLAKTGCKTAVVGLSGGLDSTLTLIVTVRAFDALSLDRAGIIAVTMPCFGTTSRTKSNACKLAEAYGVSLREVSIANAVRVHFEDIGQDENKHDITFENAQARERTQVLMDIANMLGGLVIGTGDLSESALGWATYNGDHISMYNVNCSIPKTLVRHLVRYTASVSEGELSEVLLDILATPVSPELLPPKDGEISQCTEEIVGPYELHDFFLYYLMRFGFTPEKIFRMACNAFGGRYDGATVKKWLCIFLRRFLTQQFKRSCVPDGPKVGTVALSPRGDWRMPSDVYYAQWIERAEAIEV